MVNFVRLLSISVMIVSFFFVESINDNIKYPHSSDVFNKIFFPKFVLPSSISEFRRVILFVKINSMASKNVVFPNPLGPDKMVGFASCKK